MSGFTYFTKDALEHLKADLQRLKAVERPAASKAIAEAREKGDLRENAEYDAAKEAQGLLEAKPRSTPPAPHVMTQCVVLPAEPS